MWWEHVYPFSEFVKQSAETSAAFTALLATVLGALFASLSTALLTRQTASHPPADFKATGNIAQDSRLAELRGELTRYQALAKWNRRAGALLTFGQYVVGGALASSFIQQSLSPNIVGSLGLLVLISSLIHQRVRPDLLENGASQKANILRNLIRTVEDDVFALENNYPEAPSMLAIRKNGLHPVRLTASLS